MSLKRVNLKGIGPRLTISITLLLFLSLTVVSTTIYFLLANSLRDSDRNLLVRLKDTYSVAFLDGGIRGLEGKISPEILVTILNKEGQILYEHLPQYIDQDFEDEDEIRQIKSDSRELPLSEDWHTILLLSGDEDKDFFKKMEYQFRLFAREKNWQSILPLIDNDLIEVYVAPVGDRYWMKIGRSSEEREEHLASIRYIAFMVFIPFIFIGIILSILLSRSLLSPIRDLARTIQLQGIGDTRARGKTRGTRDEIDTLTVEFNSLLDKNEVLLTNLRNTVDNVAHDIRTPLTRFRAGAEEALLNSSDSEVLKNALEEAMENSDKILQLLNAIMDVTEAESQTLRLKKEKVTISEILDDLVLLYEYVAEEKNIEIKTHVESDLLLHADKSRLLQALSNLLDNAIKYSGENSTIFLRAWEENGMGKISARDEGPGIAPEEQSRIWNRLYRGDKSRSTSGLGIGLSLVKAIVESHGGEVKVKSHPGQGSEFTITLPLCNEAVSGP